ncbi:MAG: sulfatase family protein [Gaiellaceae bacterium]
MQKRRIAFACVLVAMAALTTGADAGRNAATPPPVRPNIIVIMTDDQTVESIRVMKNVRRLLAAQGTTFDNSFASFSLCCPSRATFLTGQYAHNHGVLSNKPPYGGYYALDSSNTLPVWLKRAGYETILVGKYLNEYGEHDKHEIPPGWTEWHGAVNHSAYRFYGYTLNENGMLVKYGKDRASYQTDVYADKAVEIVRRRASGRKPFFLWLSFLAPHVGGPPTPGRSALTTLPAPRHLGRFAAAPLPTSPSFNEEDVSDKPGSIRTRPPLSDQQVAAITERYHLRLESLLAVDEAVGRIVSALKKKGELSQTLIVFTSDNGFLQGEHRIPIGKERPYEPSTRVPLVMRGPGIPAGLQMRQPVANIDLAPTIVAAARTHADLPMDGRSLWPLFADPGIFWGRDLLHEGPLTEEAQTKFTALRTPRWLYVRYLNGSEELYDLLVDPNQLTNLRTDPASAAVRADLRGRLTGFQSCIGADCRRGPQLALAVEVAGECPTATAKIGLAAVDPGSVAQARLLLPGEIVELAAAPWEAARPLGRSAANVRAHVIFKDGREMTRDAVLPACPP